MRESFSRTSTDEQVQKMIKSGIDEYLMEKFGEVKDEQEIVSYGIEKAEDPISRKEFEEGINGFLENNFEAVASMVINGEGTRELDRFEVLNRDLRNFGFGDTSIIVESVLQGGNNYQAINKREGDNYYAGSWTDELTIPDVKEFDYYLLRNYKMRVQYPDIGDNYSEYKKLAEIIATGYLKEHIRIDGKLEVGSLKSIYPQRYFHTGLKRYLAENDFGMKSYEGNADVSDITPFAETVQRQVRKVISNTQSVKNAITDRDKAHFEELESRLVAEYQLPNYPDYNSPDYQQVRDERQQVEEKISEEIRKAKEEKLVEAFNDPEIKDLILNAVPYRKFINEVSAKNKDAISKFIEQKFKEENNSDLFKKLEYVQSDEFKNEVLGLVFSDIKDSSEIGNGYVIAHSIEHDKPVLIEGQAQLDNITGNVIPNMVQMIKDNIIDAYPDERMGKIIRKSIDGTSQSGATTYKPDDIIFYNALDKLGIDRFLEIYPDIAIKVLQENRSYENRNLSEFVNGVDSLYKIFGNQVSTMDTQKLNKEIWHNKALSEAGVWNYFAERATNTKAPAWDNSNFEMSHALKTEHEAVVSSFLNNLSVSERKNLFFEGKQMYWLGKQVQSKIFELERNKNIQNQNEHNENPDTGEFKFYQHHDRVDWGQYDCKNVDVNKLSEYLKTHGNIICTLLANKNEGGQIGSNINIETIMQVVEAMEAGADMRGVALAFDKKKYLEGILSGSEQKNDLEYALKDWPQKLRNEVSLEEFEVYFENAEEYLYQDPNGMVRYATFLQNEPGVRELLGEKIEKKSDLDLRLCLSVQAPDVRNWYFEGAEYIGHNALQKYFVRFNATRQQTGGYPNLHDALYWIPNIKRVAPGEARALLDDVDTVDESNELRDFLARYDKEKDNFAKDGAIKSLRELKKRVFAIESNIDLSTLTPEMLDIISAPGFNLTELKRLQGEARFTELVEGKLDKEQPFIPHTRVFTARPLGELLKEGLGSFKEKITGTAQDPKGLFSDIRKLMQGRDVNGKKMEIQDLLREVPLDMEEDVIKLLQAQKVATGVLLEATVHAKSDPDGWVCGNYTDCCMPFGDSKNTDYMFNKGTQYFTVKYNNRIIAQSVVVDAVDRQNNESVIILDNIEIANNYKNQAPILSKIYKTFWAEYTSLPVKIGTGHSDLTPDSAVLVSNNYLPKHSLSYSDATGSNIYDLPKIKGLESIDKILTFANLSERDVDTIAEMEKAAYPEGMVQGKGEALEVIRKSRELDLPGAAASFILRQGNEPAGYLLVLPEESKLNKNETVAHIYDMAVLPKFQGTTVARKMMERMLDTAKAYNVPAIEFEARESTSYRLITNPRIQKWMELKGYKLSYNELLPAYINGEDFYYVRLDKVQNQE